jgi:hypothetical protein
VGRPELLALAISSLGVVACAPATLGTDDAATPASPDAATSGDVMTRPSPPPPPPPPAVSCGDGTVMTSGSTVNGPFMATAINISGSACASSSSVGFFIAGNQAPIAQISFYLPAEFLAGGGVRLPLGTQAVGAGISYRPGKAVVAITAADDAFWGPDGGTVYWQDGGGAGGPRVTGSFEVYDGDQTVTGTFSAPFCNVGPCPPTGE